MSAAEELLEELGLAAGAGDPRALDDLLRRFDARVPHVAAVEAREPERVARDFLEAGAGTLGWERTRAAAHLARLLGFAPRFLRGVRRVGGERPHAALLFALPSGDALADPAFPLAGLVPAGAAEAPSAWGPLELSRRGDALVLALEALGAREEVLSLSIAPDEEAAFASLPGAEPGTALRLFDDRVAFLAGGLLTLRDRWSVLTQPFADAVALERLFGAPVAPVPARDEPALLSVFDRAAIPPSEARARIATPQGLLELAPPGVTAGDVAPLENGWSWRLLAEGSDPRPEHVARTEDGASVVCAEGLVSEKRYRAAEAPGGTRLALEATLRNVPPRGLPEPVRKTLVFHLVSELMAWGRAG